VTSWTHDGLDPIYATGVAGTNTYLRYDFGALLGEVGAGTNGAEWYVTDALLTIYGRVAAGGAFTNGTVDYSDYGVEIQTPQSVRPTAGATGLGQVGGLGSAAAGSLAAGSSGSLSDSLGGNTGSQGSGQINGLTGASGAVASWGFEGNSPRFAFGYTGERTDPSRGGMNHFYARSYDARTAGWMGVDSHRGSQYIPESMLRYGYGAQSPVTFVDHRGYLFFIPIIIVALKVAAVVSTAYAAYEFGKMVAQHQSGKPGPNNEPPPTKADIAIEGAFLVAGGGKAPASAKQAVKSAVKPQLKRAAAGLRNAGHEAMEGLKNTWKSVTSGGTTSAKNEGVVYLREDASSGSRYVGQAKSESRFLQRQSEHARANPNADYEFSILGRAKPGQDLDLLEERHIRQGGGPINKSNPSGALENKRHQMSDARYFSNGGW
jgi:RHS repeat-associated protein